MKKAYLVAIDEEGNVRQYDETKSTDRLLPAGCDRVDGKYSVFDTAQDCINFYFIAYEHGKPVKWTFRVEYYEEDMVRPIKFTLYGLPIIVDPSIPQDVVMLKGGTLP